MSDVVEVLSELVSRPTTNPPGDTREVASYVRSLLGGIGFSCKLVSPDEVAVSVLAEIGNPAGPTVMFHAHTDTVPVGERESWTVEPFSATVRDDRVYGRGAADDKGALAAMLCAAERLAPRAREMKGRLVLVAAADEEAGGVRGSRLLVDQLLLGQPDFVVIGEQTGNRVAIAHKGSVRTQITVAGKAAHSTNPRRGINAINKMARVILALERYDDRLQKKKHRLLGSPSLSIGLISGGTAHNVVADRCTITLDRRFVPGENPTEILSELQELLGELSFEDPDLMVSMGGARISESFETEGRDEYTAKFMEAVRQVAGINPGPVGFLPGTDAKHLKRLPRANVVIFGPGSYEQAHSPDEWLPIPELRQSVQILARFAETVLL